MKSMVRAILALSLFAWAAPAAVADERILSYDSIVEVSADGSLDVTETIRIRAEGNRINRGIYRDFPTRYKDRYGNNVVVDFEMIGVERNGRTEPWFTERMSNGIRINTGSDVFIERPAEHLYTLRYRTTRQVGFFGDHDELYWNAIGTGWDFPIDQGSVEVRLPVAVPIADMSAEGYTGPQGAKEQNYEATLPAPGTGRWNLTRMLHSNEGFTTVLSFPKGVVTAPTSGQRAGWFLKDNRGVLVALAGFIVLLVYCIRRWRQVGRDPRKGVIIARYDPPEGRSPADLRFMTRGSYDTRSFTADVLSLSVAGLLRINREKKMLGKDKWSIERTDEPVTGLDSPSQQALMATLFSGRSGKKKVDLADSNSLLRATQTKHNASLDSQFHPEYFKRNVGSFGIAMLIVIATGIAAFVVSGGGGIIVIIGICVLMLIVAFTFGFLVEAPTAKGRALLDEIEGLKLYLSVAERDELKKMEGPGAPPPLDAKRYETLLPYAVALNVEDAWTDKFTAAVGAAAAAAATAGLTWYHGGGIDSLGSLTQAVGSSFNSAISSASTPPGSSSGGGGGGSSGGGGGGGGGGGR
jgi:uncharacterized membrane protein YgcG